MRDVNFYYFQPPSSPPPLAAFGKETFEVTRTEAQWRDRLSEAAYLVMRNEETEVAYPSDLHDEKGVVLYHCTGCNLALYASEDKHDSGTGWPSFTRALPDAIRTKPDNTFFTTRTKVHCRRCGSHLGHIFDDGPPPTEKRHCLNGVSLAFSSV